MNFNFSIKKQKEKKKINLNDKTGLFESEKKENIKKQLITTSDDLFNKEPKPLVIPLVENKFDNQNEKNNFTIEDKARKALKNELDENGNEIAPILLKEKEKENVPLLLRNKIPGIEPNLPESEKYKKQIEILPDEISPDSEVYNEIPVDLFGAAMLRGMGWKEGMAVGLHCEEPCKIIQPEVRVSGLGLGATPLPEMRMGSMFPKQGDKIINIRKLQVGAFVGIIGGEYKGHYGKIIEMDNKYGLEKYLVNLESLDVNKYIIKSYILLIPDLNTFNEFTRKYNISNPSNPLKSSRSRERSRERSRSKERKHKEHKEHHHHHHSKHSSK